MPTPAGDPPMTAQQRKVIFASSLGTVFEWYDFYLYGTLAVIIGNQFFSALDPAWRTTFSLLAFAAGFVVRPFGALVFGSLGDLMGRKYTFLVSILIMGLSTFFVGLLPNYDAIGVTAPVVLILLRMLQGLALGGEYGGGVTFVAEHAPPGKRGFYTSWIQTTATLGLLLSLLVILGVRTALGEADFADWGWRIPFLLSIVLLGVSAYIRLRLHESPMFVRMKARGGVSRAPVAESFGQWKNLRVVLLALFGLTAGQAVVWYASQFYALFFLTQALKVDSPTANLLVALALLIGAPFFVLFGALSDRIGRKPIILAGLVLAAVSYFPVFKAMTLAANPALAAAQANYEVVLQADPAECSLLFDPAEAARFTSSCDIARQVLAEGSVSYSRSEGAAGVPAQLRVGKQVISSYSAARLSAYEARQKDFAFRAATYEALELAGYPPRAEASAIEHAKLVALLAYLVILVTMVYGPLAAMLAEMFPTRIRYTALSLPYHLGNGWFGGLLPAASFAIVAQTGNMYSGLWYPVLIASGSAIVCMLFIRETRHVDMEADARPEAQRPSPKPQSER